MPEAEKKNGWFDFLMTYGWAILIVIVVIAALYAMGVFTPAPSLADNCVNSGGTVETALCCSSVSDFPDECTIGACGCAEADSHNVQVCTCPAGQCFDGNSCVS
jgi:hypothetical protein